MHCSQPFKRRRQGKESRSYYGRFAVRKGERVVTTCLDTADFLVAAKRLHDRFVEAQREAEGIIAPRAIRGAAAMPLRQLLAEYRTDMQGRELTPNHIKESVRRIERVIAGAGWMRLADVTPESFVRWRGEQSGYAAKTKHEFQTSVNAFLNWLVRVRRSLVNPLAGIDAVKRQGKDVRVSRAFTHEEFAALVHGAPEYRRIVYLVLGYTGLRKRETKMLSRDAVDLDKGVARVVGKGGKYRVVPLRAELVDVLRGWCGSPSRTSQRLFPVFPSDDALHADMRRAGIERKDASGRVLHWHAFRKTFATWAAVSGVGMRSTQAVLGHSTPALTANIYTDVEALPLRKEVEKMPWFGAQNGSQNGPKTGEFRRFWELLVELVNVAESAFAERLASDKNWLPDMDLKKVFGPAFFLSGNF